MLVLYDETEETFETLGIGVLTDFKTVPIITEVLNGEYILEFDYLKKGKYAEYLNERNIIKALGQPFRIENIKPSKDGYKILARHIVFDLRDNYLLDVSPTNKTAQDALNWVLNRMEFPTNFVASGDCDKVASARYVRLNANEALWDADNSILNRFGGELEYNKYNIILHKVRGNDTNIEIREKKNLSGFEMNIDLSPVKTRIQPVGNDGITLPEIYVDSPLINSYPTPKIGKLEVNVGVDDDTTLNQAYVLMREAVQEQYDLGLDKPVVSLKVDFIELSKTEEYKDFQNLETINLGDRLRFFMPSINQNTQIRVIKVVKNALNGRITSLELGNEIPNIITQQQVNNKTMQEKITASALTQAKIDATKLINHPFNGHLFISEDTGELYIADTDDLSTAQYIWKWGLGGLGFSRTGINGTFETAWTQDGKFVADFITAGHLNTNVIEGYGNLVLTVQDHTDVIGNRTGRSTTITQDIDQIEAEISDIADITKSEATTTAITQAGKLDDINQSYPINIEVHPIVENISYLYPHNGLFPSSTTYLKNRLLRFTNTKTNEIFDYLLPNDLLYYDENTYDSFIVDYENLICKVIKKCKYNADGTVSTLTTPVETSYDFATEIEANLNLTSGDYIVSLPGYTTGYIFVRLMAQNVYTAQFATEVQLKASILSTKQSITSEVAAKYATKDQANSLSTRISQTVRSISLTANDNGNSCGLTIKLKNEDGTELSSEQANITLSGLVKFTDLSNSGSTTINGANITTGTISAARLDSSVITTSNFSAQTVNASKITTGTLDASKITVKNLSASSITTGTLDASKITVNNINASKITGGTLNASVVQITNLNADNITSGTLTGRAISGSTITGGSISITKGSYYFNMGVSSSHPNCSGLNVGSGGVNINGLGINTSSDTGGLGTLIFVSSGLTTYRVRTTGGVRTNLIDSRSGNPINILSGGSSGTASGGGILLRTGSGHITLDARNGSGYVYAAGVGVSSSKVLTNSGEASSKNVKTNIELFDKKDYVDALELLEKIDLYSYDYKYKLSNNQHQYGFIIDEIEKQNGYNKFFNFSTEKAKVNGEYLDFDIDSNTDDESVIEVKHYDPDILDKYLLTCIKGLQEKINELERRLV